MARSTSHVKSVSLRTSIIVSIILLIVTGLGCYLVQRGFQSLETTLESTAWPQVSGVVTRSAVREFVTEKRENGRVVPNKESRTYAPGIEYRYTIADREYTGTRVSIEDASIGTKASAQAIVDAYPVGKAVTVSYETGHPEESVLEPGNWWGTYRWFLPGGLLVLVPLLILRGIWSSPREATLIEVKADQNHPERIRLLSGMLMREEILCWEPGREVHLYRPRVGYVQSIAGAIVASLLVGGPLGMIPAIFFLSGFGIAFLAKFYLAISALMSIGFAIGLLLHGRRREYVLDWSLDTITWQIGWNRQEAPLEAIEQLTMILPTAGSQPNPIVDSYRIVATLQGKKYTLLETNGSELSRMEVREKLTRPISELAEALQINWTVAQDKATK